MIARQTSDIIHSYDGMEHWKIKSLNISQKISLLFIIRGSKTEMLPKGKSDNFYTGFLHEFGLNNGMKTPPVDLTCFEKDHT